MSRVKISEETVFLFSFSDFLRNLSENFFRLPARNLQKSCQNYLLRDQRNNLWLEIFFKSFETFWIFCRNLWLGSQVSIYVSRVKLAEEKVFFHSSFLNFSGFWAKIFSDFWPKNVKNLSKLPSTRLRGTICGLKYFFESFKSFWIFCRNLWNGSQVSIYVSRVKFAEETVFWFFFSDFFSDFEQKFCQTFGEKTSKSCQNYLLRDQRNNLWLEIFFKSFESFWIFCRNLWHGSQVSNYVSKVKIAEETVFWFFFSEFFRNLREKLFRLSAKKLQKDVKTTFCVTRGTICGLKYFLKVLNCFGFSAETFGMVLKFLYTCPE